MLKQAEGDAPSRPTEVKWGSEPVDAHDQAGVPLPLIGEVHVGAMRKSLQSEISGSPWAGYLTPILVQGCGSTTRSRPPACAKVYVCALRRHVKHRLAGSRINLTLARLANLWLKSQTFLLSA